MTHRQAETILQLAQVKRYSTQYLSDRVAILYGKKGLYRLTQSQAEEFIKELGR
jgi:hypothetical protein